MSIDQFQRLLVVLRGKQKAKKKKRKKRNISEDKIFNDGNYKSQRLLLSFMIVDIELTFWEVRLIQMSSRIFEETIIVKKTNDFWLPYATKKHAITIR